MPAHFGMCMPTKVRSFIQCFRFSDPIDNVTKGAAASVLSRLTPTVFLKDARRLNVLAADQSPPSGSTPIAVVACHLAA